MSSPRPELQVVILAAGQGKRMRSDLPKVLHPLGGKPVLAHVVDTAASLSPAHTCVVIGHGGQHVKEAFEGRPIAWAIRQPDNWDASR